MPLVYNNKLVGILNVSTKERLNNEIIVITKLLSDYILTNIQIPNKSHSFSKLTNKHVNILRLIANGYTEKAIALELNLSINTIRYHKKRIFKTLKVNSNCGAIMKAIKYDIIRPV